MVLNGIILPDVEKVLREFLRDRGMDVLKSVGILRPREPQRNVFLLLCKSFRCPAIQH